MAWTHSRYSSGSRSSDESGQQRSLLPRGARTFVRVGLLEVVLPKGRLYTEDPCPHADNDRIAAIQMNQSPPQGNYINHIAPAVLVRNVRMGIARAGQSVSRIKPMFGAEIQWLASGPTLKFEGRLVADWAEQARSLVTKDVLPKGLIVDLTEVSYIDSAGEQLLKWLASVGAVFVAGSVYAFAVCDRLRLPLMQRIVERRKRPHERGRERSSIKQSHPVEAV